MSDHNPNLDNYKVVAEDGNEYGPVSAELVQAWLKQGVIDRHSMVKKEGDDQWHALLNFAELQPGPPVLDAPPPADGSEPAPSPETQAGHFGKPIPPPDYFQDPALAAPRKGLGKGAIVGIVVGVLILMCILTAVIGAVLDQSDDTGESDGSITAEDQIVGEWKGSNEGTIVTFIFNADGTANMIEGNNVLESNAEVKIKWSIDDSQDPMHLDITFVDTVKGEAVTLRMIARLIGKNKLHLGMMSDDPSDRPTSFLNVKPDDKTILDRQ